MTSLDILGLIATCFTTSSFVPQVWRTWRTRDVSGISLASYAVITVGQALVACAVRDMVQHHHVERRQVFESRGRHAVHHPAVECIARHDEAKLEFAHLCALCRHQVR